MQLAPLAFQLDAEEVVMAPNATDGAFERVSKIGRSLRAGQDAGQMFLMRKIRNSGHVADRICPANPIAPAGDAEAAT
jgi:hypothetical protein